MFGVAQKQPRPSRIDTGMVAPKALPKIATGIAGFDELTPRRTAARPHHAPHGRPGLGQDRVRAAMPGQRRAHGGRSPASSSPSRKARARSSPTPPPSTGACPRSTANKLFFLDARLSPEVVQSGEFDLSGMLAMLKAKKDEIGAHWIVFDGIDVLLTLLQDPAAGNARNLPHPRLAGGQRADAAIITAKIDGALSEAVNYDFMQFMVDCVVRLRAAPGARGLAAPAADHEVSRLGFRGGRVSGELRAAGHGGGRPRAGRDPARGFERAGLGRLRAPRHDAGRRACSAAAAR